MTERYAQDIQAQAIYNQLELMSNVDAASPEAHVHAGKPGSKQLTFGKDKEPDHLELRRRYNNAHTTKARQAIIDEFDKALRELKHSRRNDVDLQTLEGRLTVGRDTRPASKLADIYGYTIRHIHWLRAEARKYDARQAA